MLSQRRQPGQTPKGDVSVPVSGGETEAPGGRSEARWSWVGPRPTPRNLSARAAPVPPRLREASARLSPGASLGHRPGLSMAGVASAFLP